MESIKDIQIEQEVQEKVSFIQMENELRSRLEEYEHLAASTYDEAVNRSQVKRMLSEEAKQRARNRSRVIRLVAMGASALGAVFFYKSFFGW